MSIPSHAPHITDREHDVLDLLVKGLSSCEIASKLGVKKSTVDAYRRAIRLKSGGMNAVQLIYTYPKLLRKNNRQKGSKSDKHKK